MPLWFALYWLIILLGSSSVEGHSNLVKYYEEKLSFGQYCSQPLGSSIFHQHKKRDASNHLIDSSISNTPNTSSVDLSNLNKVLSVDFAKKCITVEAGCSMEQLLRSSLSHGLVPKVLPELKDITVGGAIAGAALESSSFRFGQFNDVCSRIWVLTADRRVLECSTKHNNDLYGALPGSYGTLGSVLAAEIQCIEVKSNRVEVKVQAFDDLAEGLESMFELANNQQIDFLEALQFNHPSNKLVVITAQMMENEDINEKVANFDVEQPSELFFYEYLEDIAYKHSCISSFTMSLSSFLFRYDRGAFWMARPIRFKLSNVLQSPMLLPLFLITSRWSLMRRLFRWFFTTKRLWRLLKFVHGKVLRQRMVIVDMYVKKRNVLEFIHFVRQHIPIDTPLWLCPIKPALECGGKVPQPFSPHGIVCRRDKHEMMVDVGVYGRVPDGRGEQYSRLLDLWALKHHARKMLYSQHTYSKGEFWLNETNDKEGASSKYDATIYESLRRKYGAEHLPDLYEKQVGRSLKLKEKPWRWNHYLSWLLL